MTRVLIADDSIFQRDNLRFLLELYDYTVLEASNGAQALGMVTTYEPDCVVLDIIMPEMSGLEVLAALSQRHPEIPVIVLTADIQHSTCEKCRELGAVAVLHKPVEGEQLQQTIRQALAVDEEGHS